MKGKLCFGLLLLLSITVGLSLNVSSDVSALNYPITTLSFGSDTLQFRKMIDSQTNIPFYGAFKKYNHLIFISTANTSLPSGFSYPHSWRFSGSYDSLTNTCSIPSFISGNETYYSDGVYYSYYSDTDNDYYSLRDPYHPAFSYEDFYFDSLNILDPIDSPFDLNSSLFDQITLPWYPSDMLCYIQDLEYNSPIDFGTPDIFPIWDFSSVTNIPLVNNRLEYMKSEPFVYQFDTLYLQGADKNNDGIWYTKNGLKMSEIFNSQVPTFSHLIFNFNDFTSSQNWLSPDDSNDSSTERVYNFSIKGSIKFDSDYTLGSNSAVLLDVYNYYNPYISSDGLPSWGMINNHTIYNIPAIDSQIVCDSTDFHVSSGDDDNRLDFSCYYDPISNNAYSEEINFRYMNISLAFDGDGGGSWEFDPYVTTSGDYTFIDWSITTNNDPTPSGWSGSSSGSGGNISSAPGTITDSPGGTGSDGSVDWTTSLKDLFNFSFINPFTPIFALFTNQSTCVNIPTIANMLHSEETQVCPWFSAETRAIVTPVVGIVSMMLIFGFAVRWLGASSGNLFEDSGHIEPPGGYTADVRGRNVKPRGWRRSK